MMQDLQIYLFVWYIQATDVKHAKIE